MDRTQRIWVGVRVGHPTFTANKEAAEKKTQRGRNGSCNMNMAGDAKKGTAPLSETLICFSDGLYCGPGDSWPNWTETRERNEAVLKVEMSNIDNSRCFTE